MTDSFELRAASYELFSSKLIAKSSSLLFKLAHSDLKLFTGFATAALIA